MSKFGRRLEIRDIHEINHNSNPLLSPKIDKVIIAGKPVPFKGRPSKVLKRFIALGFQRGYWGKEIISELIEFGFDAGYWDDSVIFAKPFEYFLTDKNLPGSKDQRLKEVTDGDGEQDG